jgi:hypothetical protein
MPRQFKPGDKVPISGIYRVRHDNDHEAEHEVVCVEGKRFPRCHGCVRPRFIPGPTALRIESHDQFKLPKSDARALSRRHGGLVIIICCLITFGVVGVTLIRSAPHLANVPRIASLAQLVLFPHAPPDDGSSSYKEEERDLLIGFFNEVGVAFIVAVILGVTFEISMRRREERQHSRHLEEIEKAGLTSLLGYLMPASISDEIRRVFEEKIMRSNLQVKFTFKKAPLELLSRDPDSLLVIVKVEYDLVNLTKKATRYTVDHGFEPILALDSDHNYFVRLKITQGDEILLYWTKGLPIPQVRVRNPKPCLRALTVKDSVEIGPGTERGVADKNKVHVVVEYQVVRRQRDQDSWTTWLPADRLDVRAEVEPGSGLDLDFHHERTHPVKFEETKLSATDRKWSLPSYEVERGGEKEEISIGVLPYQGFTLYWFPSNSGCGPPQSESGQSEWVD